jgi:queuine tRNA-ribosyltransferase
VRPDQALFGIVQGGVFDDLRAESARVLVGMDFAGYAIGGLSVGESKADTRRVLDTVTPLLPRDRPRYLMGVGAPEDLIDGVSRGIDMFDCVLPTRLARNGAVFHDEGRLNLRNARFREDPAPIQEGCTCYTCRHFSRAYIRHLLMAKEMLGPRLNSIHNVHFILNLMGRIRQSLLDGTFADLRDSFLARYHPSDPTARVEGRRKWVARLHRGT